MRVTVRFAENAPDRETIDHLRSADHLDGIARLLLAEQDGEACGTLRLNWGGDAPFVMLAGAVDVVQNGQTVTRQRPGSVSGEAAFLAGVPRTADIAVALFNLSRILAALAPVADAEFVV